MNKLSKNKNKSALYIGRFQPFHKGHFYIFKKLLRTHDSIVIGVINRPRDDKNPYPFTFVKKQIESSLALYKKKYKIVKLGNITSFNYGRKVGYKINRVKVPKKIEKISATSIRKKLLNKRT